MRMTYMHVIAFYGWIYINTLSITYLSTFYKLNRLKMASKYQIKVSCIMTYMYVTALRMEPVMTYMYVIRIERVNSVKHLKTISQFGRVLLH